ncbi:MAG: hypothetical protein GWN31_12625 [Candidatus Thorarchaeota archaeon]|nr:hypothetical protein [Candidatus Thorarchaeota archaeon]NIW14742.1 hypothetical protein [Candidatus Thorarchaeota archaeon]NIW52568.1 hypothetical protein [Candidatus Korarchaeota archaeon]
MIYFLQLIKTSSGEAFFTFTHPITSQNVLKTIEKKVGDSPLTLLKKGLLEGTSKKIDFEKLSLQFCPVNINGEDITVAVLYDQGDNTRLVTKIVDDLFPPHIRAKLANQMKKGTLTEETSNLLTNNLLNLVNAMVDPISKKWETDQIKKLLFPLAFISIWTLLYLSDVLLLPLLKDLSLYQNLILLSLIAAGIGFLFNKNKPILKTSGFCVLIGTLSYITFFFTRFSTSNLGQLSPLFLCTGGIFILLTGLLLVFDNHYLAPSHKEK